MPKIQNKTKNEDKAAVQAEQEEKELQMQLEEKPRTGTGGLNPYMQRLAPEMLAAPYPLEIGRGRIMNSLDFALAKLDNLVVRPLGLETEAEWLAFARLLFAYRQRLEEQRVEEQANKLLDDLKQNPGMLQRLVNRLNLELAAQQNGTPAVLPSVFPQEYGGRTPLDVSRYS